MLFDETKFKPIVRYGRQIPGYYVSKEGQVFSTKTQRIIKYGITRSKGTERIESLKFTANVPKDFFEDYSYRQRRKGENTATISLTAHRTVMEVWKPIDENPPEQLKKTWDQVPEEWRQWVRETALIDHIDNDPTNNHVDNLRWVTPKENNVFRKRSELHVRIYELEEDSESFRMLSELAEIENISLQEMLNKIIDESFEEENSGTKGLVKFYQSDQEESD
jgi:hypothetical protein